MWISAEDARFRRVYFVLMQEGAHHRKVYLESVRGPFGIRLGSVRNPFGVRSGSVCANFGPKFSEPNLKFQKISICVAVAAAAGAL